ncbi:ABC transporter substrate-binding protein [Paenibacillus daejeonensis]|uniref:ABC transporter substrate-binding protein n=1 Tax=Paenibacillus daejeonensis TaxID=135193 RepID=UPI00036FEA2E|nr:extracellular solute-binding protein [Paenibacillus daejeonensis]
MRKQPWRKWMSTGLTMTLLVPLLAACTGDGGTSTAENRVLRIGVLYGGEENEPWFRQQYTDMYEFNNNNIEIQIVPAIDYSNMRYAMPDQQQEQPDPYEEMQKMLNGDNPVDVVVVEYNMLRRLVQDNSLKQLDPLMQEDGFSVDDYVPTVLKGIKTAGDGNIFALTPTFTSSALYYNKKIFSDAGVEPPTDGMQWPDVFNKARLVTAGEGEDRKYGFMMNRWGGDGFWDLQTYVDPLQLKVFDDKVEKMLVNSDQWTNAWETISGLYRDKIIPTSMDMQSSMTVDRPMSPFEHDAFLSGKVAMMIGDYYYLNDLKRAQQSEGSVEGFEMIDWDVVTVPEHPEKPGVGGNIMLSALMGINAKAQNPDDAWEYIKFVNSEAWAKLRSRSVNEMVARQQFLKPREGLDYNMAAFYTMEPSQPMSMEMEAAYRKYPNIYEVTSMGQPLFQEVIEGKKTAQEALAEWETKGDAALQQMKTNPDASAGGGTEEGGSVEVQPAPAG